MTKRNYKKIRKDWDNLRDSFMKHAIFRPDEDAAAEKSLACKTIGMFFRIVGVL